MLKILQIAHLELSFSLVKSSEMSQSFSPSPSSCPLSSFVDSKPPLVVCSVIFVRLHRLVVCHVPYLNFSLNFIKIVKIFERKLKISGVKTIPLTSTRSNSDEKNP